MDPVIGRVTLHSMFDSKFVSPRNVWVWIPSEDLVPKNTKFAVLYMHDGQNLFDPSLSYAGVDWGVDETLTRLIEAESIQPTLVVAISNTRQRVLEYMPQKAMEGITGSKAQLRIEALRIKGEVVSDNYLRFITSELKPFIDSQYPTLTDMAHTYIMGSSMGALISMYAVCEYPQVFSSAACISTHWPIANGISIRYFREHIPPAGNHKFYFDYGTHTLDSQYELFQKRADRILRDSGYQPGKDWVTWKFDGADHSEDSWRERLETPMKFLLGT
jgi:predicted alpha/beta superfamily hydrolase